MIQRDQIESIRARRDGISFPTAVARLGGSPTGQER
jgi:hypothetical protein